MRCLALHHVVLEFGHEASLLQVLDQVIGVFRCEDVCDVQFICGFGYSILEFFPFLFVVLAVEKDVSDIIPLVASLAVWIVLFAEQMKRASGQCSTSSQSADDQRRSSVFRGDLVVFERSLSVQLLVDFVTAGMPLFLCFCFDEVGVLAFDLGKASLDVAGWAADGVLRGFVCGFIAVDTAVGRYPLEAHFRAFGLQAFEQVMDFLHQALGFRFVGMVVYA